MFKILILSVILIFIFIYLISGLKLENYNNKNFNDPCDINITDKQYLFHMIPHHQVAIDISIMLQKKTKNPVMQKILRELIWTQQYEINLMQNMLNRLPSNISDGKMKKNYIENVFDTTKPNKLEISDTFCDPNFFDPEKHMKHMKHMNLNDTIYIDHMIPHHQVAIDMSKKLLKNTKNDFMIHLAYRIIRSQNAEIVLLTDQKKSLRNISKFY